VVPSKRTRHTPVSRRWMGNSDIISAKDGCERKRGCVGLRYAPVESESFRETEPLERSGERNDS